MVIEVEMEVSVRKYPVNAKALAELLISSKKAKGLTNEEVAKLLNVPKIMAEHWFRRDKYFAIPDSEIWPSLKALLGIETDEFDKSIMTFEHKGSEYDMSNRIHYDQISPTLTGSTGLHLLEEYSERCTMVDMTKLQKKEYMGKEDAIKAFKYLLPEHKFAMMKLIEGVPSADVVEREEYEKLQRKCERLEEELRNVCGKRRRANVGDYEPNCGAGMRKPPTEEIGDCNVCRFAGCSECDDCVNGSQWVREVKGVDYDYEEQERLYDELADKRGGDNE